jgi:hypothetical protein
MSANCKLKVRKTYGRDPARGGPGRDALLGAGERSVSYEPGGPPSCGSQHLHPEQTTTSDPGCHPELARPSFRTSAPRMLVSMKLAFD